MKLKVNAKLDPKFQPLSLICREMRENTKENGQDIVIAVERNKGYTTTYKTRIFKDNTGHDEENFRFVERIVKTLLWVRGGYKVIIAGSKLIADRIKADYAEGGICEGGWVPLDTVHLIHHDDSTQEYHSAGYHTLYELEIFHGNGHVIRNLKINASSDTNTDTDRYVGLFGNTNAEIIHLGLEDCTVTVRETVTKPFATYALYDNLLLGITVHVGGIAGHAEYIGGCYVKGLTLDLTTDFAWLAYYSDLKEQYDYTALYNLNVGGIAGSCNYETVSNCYTMKGCAGSGGGGCGLPDRLPMRVGRLPILRIGKTLAGDAQVPGYHYPYEGGVF